MKKLITLLLILSMMVLPVFAEPGTTEIHTPEDLAAIANDPSGSYILMEDLDMSGISWKSIDFSGKFNGNGKSILNLTITEPGDAVVDSYDGNSKFYPTRYYGMFGMLTDATVAGVNLLNVRAVIECDEPCYLGGLAGGMQGESAISGCSVSGVLELRAHESAFGIGGLVGFGSGRIEKCKTDVTLISVDTDAATKDEQFMGGLYANGSINMYESHAKINGFISEHGYVHSGAMVGMFMRNPRVTTWEMVELRQNTAEGQITFFEDNNDPRAYCKGDVGEVLGGGTNLIGNTAPTFKRNQKYGWDVTVELRPEMCENPDLEETVTEPNCTDFGFTEITCRTCGNTQRDHYTLPAHIFTTWTVAQEATETSEGLEVSKCDHCGAEGSRPIPKLEPAPTEPEVTMPELSDETTENAKGASKTPGLLCAAAACFAAAFGLGTAAVILGKQGR